MEQYISKSALVAEIERIDKSIGCDRFLSEYEKGCNQGKEEVCDTLRNFLDTLEVKDANEALRTEYEKGRADVIADTLSWLENCWPKYCSNQTIIEGFKEAIKY